MYEKRRIVLAPSRGEILPHYEEEHVEAHALRLGMWAFIASEILMFSGLFLAFVYYRWAYPLTFDNASQLLDIQVATLAAILLVTGSLLLADAEISSIKEQRRPTAIAIGITALLGFAVVAVELSSWVAHLQRGIGPGRFYVTNELQAPGVSLFFSLYYIFGGLHLLHVVGGACVLLWLASVAWRGTWRRPRFVALQMTALFWNLTVIIWLMAYPLFFNS